MLNFTEIRKVGAAQIQADTQTYRRTNGRTKMTKLIRAFSKYVNALKKYQIQTTNSMPQNVVPLRKF
jgi:hypothetical protein